MDKPGNVAETVLSTMIDLNSALQHSEDVCAARYYWSMRIESGLCEWVIRQEIGAETTSLTGIG